MKTKKLILGSLFIVGILAIVRLLFAKLFNNSPPMIRPIRTPKNKCTVSLACLAE